MASFLFKTLQRKLFPVAPAWFYECRRWGFFLRNRFYSFNLKWKCVYYISIELSATKTVAYLHVLLSTKCFNTGSFIWNSTLHLKKIVDVLIRNIQGQQYIENLKYTRNWHDFELQTHRFLHIEPKKRDVYHFSQPIVMRGISYNNERLISLIFAITVVELLFKYFDPKF